MAETGRYLTEETYTDLEWVLRQYRAGFSGGGGPTGGAGRQVTFCTITSGDTNPYVADVVDWDGTFTPFTFGSGAFVYSVNSQPLAIGTTYLCLRTGWDGSTPVYLTEGGGGVIHIFRYVCVAGSLEETVITLYVGPGGSVAVADSTCGFTFSAAGLDVTFAGYVSPGPGPVSYSWDFGDTTFGVGANPVHTYAGSGAYTVVLTVTYSDGYSVGSTVVVTV